MRHMTTKKKKVPGMLNVNDPIAALRQIGDAMHLEVLLYLPYVNGWLSKDEDDGFVNMDSVGLAMVLHMVNQCMFVKDKKQYKQ
jgi:hypothetical protein